MQETKGSVHDQPGDDGKSFGILQVQVQSGTPAQCSGTAPGACSNSTITTMVQQGVLGHSGLGTAVAPGIGFWIQQQNGNVGQALRGYNTGSVPNPNDLSQVTQGSTPSYVSSVGNRLLGVTDEAIPQAPGQLEQCGFNDPQ
ncbi:hypothetical protein MMC20_001212 [Loxospora ochrophaea]|nr:hypothetical protein [Loxospora ochrophaea]